MPVTVEESDDLTALRTEAESQLQSGTTRKGGHWSLGIDALRMLHRLSSNPDSAEDALRLLHELQVHQVELDLQNEEMAANEQALTEELHLYRELYDAAPLGCFLVDREGRIIKDNLAAAELFGVERDKFEGHTLGTFLQEESRLRLFSLLQRVVEYGVRDTCFAVTGAQAPGARQIRFHASFPASGHDYILLVCDSWTDAD